MNAAFVCRDCRAHFDADPLTPRRCPHCRSPLVMLSAHQPVHVRAVPRKPNTVTPPERVGDRSIPQELPCFQKHL